MKAIKTPEELLEFMNSINYGYLGKDNKIYYDDSNFFENYKLETTEDILTNLVGNCWDQVEFERDWFLNNNYEIKTIFEMVVLDYNNDYPTHSFLVYKDNNKWCWFEHADSNNKGIHKFNTLEELLNYQYHKYVEFLQEYNIKEEEINKIIITEFTSPNEHITASEYLENAINSPTISIKN